MHILLKINYTIIIDNLVSNNKFIRKHKLLFLNRQFSHIETASYTFLLNRLSTVTLDLGLPKHRGMLVSNYFKDLGEQGLCTIWCCENNVVENVLNLLNCTNMAQSTLSIGGDRVSGQSVRSQNGSY